MKFQKIGNNKSPISNMIILVWVTQTMAQHVSLHLKEIKMQIPRKKR